LKLDARWRSLMAVLLYQNMASFTALAIPPALPFMGSRLELTAAVAGLLMFTLYLFASLTAIPMGVMSDRLDEKRLAAISLGILAIGMALLPRSSSLTGLLLVIILIGATYSLSAPLTSKMVALWFEGHERATAMGVKQSGFTTGAALASFIIPYLATTRDLDFAFLTSSLLIMASIPPILLTYRAPRRGSLPVRGPSGIGWVLTNRRMILFSTSSFLLAFAQLAYIAHLPLFMTRALGVTPLWAGITLGLVHMAGAAGRVLLGLLSDRVHHAHRMATLGLTGTLSSAGMASLILLRITNMGTTQVIPIMLFTGFFMIGSVGLVFTASTEILGERVAGTATGLVYTFLSLGNAVGPLIFGVVADTLGYMSAWGLLAVILVAHTYLIRLTPSTQPEAQPTQPVENTLLRL
jgi:ACS family hexuronate transporter-like MFS transporter